MKDQVIAVLISNAKSIDDILYSLSIYNRRRNIVSITYKYQSGTALGKVEGTNEISILFVQLFIDLF
jgi:hypothetical protein